MKLGSRTRLAWQGILRVLLLSFLFGEVGAMEAREAAALLEQADRIRTSNHEEFARLLGVLEQQAAGLPKEQQEYVHYLRGYEQAYVGDYDAALGTLGELAASTSDRTLLFRARVTQLSGLLEQVDQIEDRNVREQALTVAALLYGDFGQHDLSQLYADKVIQDNASGLGQCRGGQIKVKSLYDSSSAGRRPPHLAAEIDKTLSACAAANELTYANATRSYQVRLHMERNELAQALQILTRHYDEVRRSRYPRLISQYDVLLADVHWRMKDTDRAREFALRAIDNAVKDEFTEPLIAAYRLLYTIEKARGDAHAALGYHEKYMTADKGYLDDIGARRLAYERVKHEVAANELEIESLRLQRELDAKAIENVRLYVALLIVILGFIVFWAYKTKRSQLHFMNLSRRDGLTGIFNRPHFMDLAESTLENCRKLKQDVSLVLCDLDNFKQINDRYGHAEDDKVLKYMVEEAQAHLRAADIFGRVGGEEFCFLLPGCDIVDARRRAEELRRSIATITERSRATISASFGVTGTTLSGYELNQLLAHADSALYQAKRTGRNCVVVYDKDSIISTLRPGTLSTAH